MHFRITAVLVALPAIVVALLVAPPAEAATYTTFVTTKNVAISTGGNGKVYVQCHATSRCRGKLSFGSDGSAPRTTSYSIPGKKSGYVTVSMHTSNPGNPNTAGAVDRGDYSSRSGVLLKVAETSPRKRNHQYHLTTETVVASQQITGKVAAVGGAAAGSVRVELVRALRGGNTEVANFTNDIPQNGTYSFNVKLGANNSSSSAYRLRVSGRDQDDIFRSWFWRGIDNKMYGGGRYLRDATAIRARKANNFDADFAYGRIAGAASSGDKVLVASPPPSYSGGTAVRRELDLTGCANVFGETTAARGSYHLDFLPVTGSTKTYMVGAKGSDGEIWNSSFGSCFDVMDYSSSHTNLVALPSTANVPATVHPSGNTLSVNGSFSGFTPTSQGDRWIRIREKVPNLPILDAPVVDEGAANSSGNRRFYNIPPGKYWVEVGRRTGCSDWYKSRFANNRAYFKGSDRLFENWKSFTKVSSVQGSRTSGLEALAWNASPNPATKTQDSVPKGYEGWAYRGVCKASGAGSYSTKNITGRNNGTINFAASTDKRGAVVKGHISRTGGRTNKEMMVRLSSSAGTRVIRTAVSDGSGNFSVHGLASGTWTVSVNPDSWRGINRIFSGRHSVSVRAGHSYRIGTLRFRG